MIILGDSDFRADLKRRLAVGTTNCAAVNLGRHHCFAALCPEHALILSDPVTAQYPVCKGGVLPLRARVFLCTTWREALRQTIGSDRDRVGSAVENANEMQRDAVTT